MINVICVLSIESKSRVRYDESWVDKLHNSISRNLTLPYKFYCLSNIKTKYNTIPLVSNSVKYWNKIELFRPNLFSGPCLYLDLDVLICNNIDDFISNLDTSKFYMCLEPYQNISNSSVLFWSGDYSFLYSEYIKDQKRYQNEYTTTKRYGDQAFLSERVKREIFEDKYFSWVHHKVNTPINEGCKFLVFTSPYQKPTNNLHLDIVKRNWK
jgi:hypothetical protein